MNKENVTLETLDCLFLTDLNGIRIVRDGKITEYATGVGFFLNPPTKKVQTMREIIEHLELELIPQKDFQSNGRVTVKASGAETKIIKTKSGVNREWSILYKDILWGIIRECGNLHTMGEDICIFVPRTNSQ